MHRSRLWKGLLITLFQLRPLLMPALPSHARIAFLTGRRRRGAADGLSCAVAPVPRTDRDPPRCRRPEGTERVRHPLLTASLRQQSSRLL